MQSPFTKQYLIALGWLFLAAVTCSMRIFIVGVPLGLVGGFLLIKEMIRQSR